jgi:Ca2+-binding RTX toxin-like protein
MPTASWAAGADSFSGGAGRDTLTGNAGGDTFVFDSALTNGADRITDFNHADDVIHLDQRIFTALAETGFTSDGWLGASAFKDISIDRVDADDRILYKSAKGVLLYDADGRGGEAAVAFATLVNQPTGLEASDFFVF